MRQPDFLYFLVNKDGKPLTGYVESYRVLEADINTLKDVNGKIAFLKNSPDGWRDVLVKFARNKNYLGLFRDFTVPLIFVKDGALIIQDALWRQGFEAYMKVVINKADRSTFPIKHKTWYWGELDLSNFEQQRGKITVNAMEGGLTKYLKANEKTPYEIPVEGVRVKMDGFFLDGKFSYTIPNNPIHAFNTHTVPVAWFAAEGTQLSISYNPNYVYYEEQPPGYEELSQAWIAKVYDTIEIKIKGKILFSNDPSAYYTLGLRYSNGTLIDIPYTTEIYDPLRTLTYIVFDSTITVPGGVNIFLEGTETFVGGFVIIERGSFTIDFKNRYKTTFINAIRPFNVLNELVKKMTDNQYEAKSDFLTAMDDFVLTSGDAIRGFEGSVIKTSLADFLESFKAIFSCGLGIEREKIAVENIAHFFQPAESHDLGVCDQLKIKLATDFCFNKIIVGYENETYKDVNGRFEFNNSQTYTPPVTKVVKELKLISKYRADPFGIEFTRINFDGKATTDSDSDNDTFILNIEKFSASDDNGTYYSLFRPDVVISGVPDPVNIFNVMLSPKHNLLRNGPLIRSGLDLMDNGTIVFQTCDKNRELVVDGLAEKDNVIIGQLGEKLFLPYMLTLDASAPINFQEALQDRPYETMSFTYRDKKLYGWVFEGGIKPATNDKQELQFLSSTKNQHTKFIQI